MRIHIGDTAIVGGRTRHHAELLPGEGWRVSWLPQQRFSQAQAETAIRLAGAVAQMQYEGQTTVADHTHPLWPQIEQWAAELGLTGPDAVVRISEPPAAASDLRHPVWCDPGECWAGDEVYSLHFSQWLVVDPPAAGDPKIRLRLVAGADEPIEQLPPRIEVEHTGGPMGHDEGAGWFELDTPQAGDLLAALAELVAIQEADDHHERGIGEAVRDA